MSDNGRHISGVREPDPLPTSSPAGRILVVDDMEANRALVASVLRRDGHLVEFADDGRAAIDFISKPFNAHELRARVRSLIRLKRYIDELDTADSVIVSLALTIEARDRYTDGHCQRLAAYASAVGRHLGLSDEDVAALVR